jgi:hypothetical protein
VSGPVTNQSVTASLSSPESTDRVTNEGWSDPMLGLLLGAGAVAGALLIRARRRIPRPSLNFGSTSAALDQREPATDTVSEELAAAIESIIQRQIMDGERRTGDPYWQSGGGRNVGYDVIRAAQDAERVVKTALAGSQTRDLALRRAVDALDAWIVRWREQPGDDDGFGIATLHEIRRDLAAL